MEFIEPINKGFTIYSKSGCVNCNKLKQLLKNNDFLFTEINCDEYLIEYKIDFLEFIKNISGSNMKVFPIVFYDQKFVGGFSDAYNFIYDLMEGLTLVFGDNF